MNHGKHPLVLTATMRSSLCLVWGVMPMVMTLCLDYQLSAVRQFRFECTIFYCRLKWLFWDYFCNWVALERALLLTHKASKRFNYETIRLSFPTGIKQMLLLLLFFLCVEDNHKGTVILKSGGKLWFTPVFIMIMINIVHYCYIFLVMTTPRNAPKCLIAL